MHSNRYFAFRLFHILQSSISFKLRHSLSTGLLKKSIRPRRLLIPSNWNSVFSSRALRIAATFENPSVSRVETHDGHACDMSSTADGETCQAVDSTKNASTFSILLDNKSLTLKALKSFLSRYVQFTQSPHRQDSILKTVQYSLWLLSKFYRNPKTRDALLKLQGEISWTRYLLRFFGFPI